MDVTNTMDRTKCLHDRVGYFDHQSKVDWLHKMNMAQVDVANMITQFYILVNSRSKASQSLQNAGLDRRK